MGFKNFVPLLPDELFCSWISRICSCNALSLKMFTEIVSEDNVVVSPDYRKGVGACLEFFVPDYDGTFDKCLEFAESKIEPAELYLRGSILPFEFLCRSKGDQARIISDEQDLRSYINSNKHFFSGINLCPECMKEDEENYGTAYVHRNHQLDSVTVCYKHGCGLFHRTFLNKNDFMDDDETWYDLSKCQPLVPSENSLMLAREYAVACAELAEAMLCSDRDELFFFITEKIKDRGYSTIKEIQEDLYFTKYAAFFSDDSKKYFTYCFKKSRTNIMKYCVVLLLYLTEGNIKEYIEFIRDKHRDDIMKEYEDFECLSRKNLPVKMFKHNSCGSVFFANDWWMEHALGCSVCCAGDNKEVFSKKVLSSGFYEHYKFLSLKNKGPGSFLHVRHKICGRKLLVKPISFIFEEPVCECVQNLTDEAVKNLIAEVPGIVFFDYDKETRSLKLYDEALESIVDAGLEDFIAAHHLKIE